jgi:hypothetical protein
MRLTKRRASTLAMLVGGLLLAAPVGWRLNAARADTGGSLGSYSFIATAPGFEVTEDEPSANAHPEGHGAVPYSATLLAGGGAGYGVSAVAWPGATFANGAALLPLVVPSQPGGQPMPDVVKGAINDVAPAANYPFRAEARAGSSQDGAFTAIPGVSMTAHADAAKVTADAHLLGASQPGAATYGNMTSSSSSQLVGTTGKADANSFIQNIDLGGGAIKIKAVSSTATATTDGSNSSANGATVVQGLTVGGQAAYIDQDGIHAGSANQPANAAANEALKQVLSGGGFKVFVSQPQTERDGGSITYSAGAVLFRWEPPNNPSKNVFTMTFGGAHVSVSAGAGFASAGETASDSGGGGASFDSGSGGGDSSVPSAAGVSDTTGLSGGTGAVSSTGTVGRSAPTRTAQPIGGQTIAHTFSGVGAGWLLVGLAAAFLLGAGSRRLIGDLLDNPAATCPLEVRR